MSYEFNPESQVFEFPNPYKVENIALILSGAITSLAGILSMISVRDRISQGLDGKSLAVVAISITLLLIGIALLARSFSQLRYFFGRNRPEDLAKLVSPDKDGDSNVAIAYKETLRQNAITFQEPHGALNGLLYSWIPHLIFAPRVIQHTAQVQFSNFLALSATLLSFLICWLMFGNSALNGWVGLIYGAFSFYQIMRPMTADTQNTTGPITEQSNIGIGGLVVLIVLALLGPVLLGLTAHHLPSLGDLSINGVVFVTLLCGLIGCGVFGLALIKQLRPAPQAIGAARTTETITMNAHPNKIIEELDRNLMSKWFCNIPNRRYTRKSPDIQGNQGKFSAELFEETQPRPHENQTAISIKHAFSTPQFFWLAVLTSLAVFFCAAGTIAFLVLSHNILHELPLISDIAFAISEFALGFYCYRAAHLLWGRFDFVSELYWIDINGSFESAQLKIGNQISGNVHTSKNVINIESMTMRVWVSEIDTVIFGKDAKRQMIGMRGLQTNADELAAVLKNFSESRSMVVAPTSSQDIERAQKIGLMNQLIQAPESSTNSALLTELANNSNNAAFVATNVQEETPSEVTSLFCGNCGKAVRIDASFCDGCGHRLGSELLQSED